MEYTALDIGAHCDFCKQHDFLPFKCEDCGLNFCLKHKEATKHECSHIYCKYTEEKKNEDAFSMHGLAENVVTITGDGSEYNRLHNNNNDNTVKVSANETKKKKKKKKKKCRVKRCKNPSILFFPCKFCDENQYCIAHLPQHKHKCKGLNLAALEARQKHQAMLMSNEAKELAKLLQCKS